MLVKAVKRKILIIDDDVIYQQIIRKLLCSTYNVILTGDSKEAIEYLETHGSPDLVIADLNLPGLDGIELISTIKEKLNTSQTNILVISGMDDEILKTNLSHLGVSEFLTKPIERKILKDKIDSLIG
jgi:two-component system response regulator YesN